MNYLTLPELSLYLKKPRHWVYNHAHLLGVRDGKSWLFSKEWADEYLEGLKNGQMVRTGQTSGQISQPGQRVRQKGTGSGSGRTAEAIITAGEDPHCPRNFLRSMGGIS
jgi:hypothetical protein